MKYQLNQVRKLLLGASMVSHGLLFADPQPIETFYIFNSELPGIINMPGTYVFLEDIYYEPTDGSPAITVESSDVIIDMNNLSFNQANTMPGISAVNIQPGYSGITIENGPISDFTQSAVTCSPDTAIIILNNLLVSGCGNRVFEFNGATGAPISFIQMAGCILLQSCTTSNADNVVTFSNCSNVQMTNCILSGNGSAVATNPLAMINISNTSQLEIANCVINNSFGTTEIDGLYLNNCFASIFENNKISALTSLAPGSTCRGINIASGMQSTQNNFQDCVISNLTGGSTVEGVFSGTGNDDNHFSGFFSAFHAASDPAGVVCGYHSVANNRNKFSHCESRAHSAPNSTATPYGAYGFLFDSTNYNDAIDCVTTDNNAAGSSVGIYATQTTSCHFNRNKSSGHTQGYDFQGIFDNNTWIQNIASNNSNTTQLNGFPANAVFDSVFSSSINTVTSPWTNVGIMQG